MREQPTTTHLTSADFARRINRTPDRVRQLARAGRIVASVITSGGQRLYSEEEAQRYAREIDAANS